MSHASDIKAVLDADTGVGGVATLLTGGIHLGEALPMGITEDDAGAAFDNTTGQVQPCLLIKTRSDRSDDGLVDEAAQVESKRQVHELYFYDAPYTGYGTIASAAARARTLLQQKFVGSMFGIRQFNEIRARAPELNKACLIRHDYESRTE